MTPFLFGVVLGAIVALTSMWFGVWLRRKYPPRRKRNPRPGGGMQTSTDAIGRLGRDWSGGSGGQTSDPGEQSGGKG